LSVVDEPKPRRGRRIALAIIAALLVTAAYAVSPLFSLIGLFAAVRSGNAAQLSERVDFPAVRGGLKSQLAGAFAQQGAGVAGDPLSAPLPQFLDQAVDRYVTPEGIAGLIARSKRPLPVSDSGTFIPPRIRGKPRRTGAPGFLGSP